jgi:hypothetical protein
MESIRNILSGTTDQHVIIPSVFLAEGERQVFCEEHPELIHRLKNGLEKIPQTELSCQRVVGVASESELSRTFACVSKYYKPEFNNRQFARKMAHDVSKLMDIDYITANEFNVHLFCMLSCILFADIDATISDIDTTKISSDILRFIYVSPHRGRPGQKLYIAVTVVNLSDLQTRKVLPSKFVKAPTFETNEIKFNEQLA